MTAENNTPDPGAPDTIVLIHGFWMTPRSWEHWIERYEGRGYRVLAPAYPGLEVEVEALRADPSPIETLTIPAIVEHLGGIIGGLERPPIIIGHSAGGLLTQILLDQGYGATGVAMVLGTPAAYAFVRCNIPRKRAWLLVVLGTHVVVSRMRFVGICFALLGLVACQGNISGSDGSQGSMPPGGVGPGVFRYLSYHLMYRSSRSRW